MLKLNVTKILQRNVDLAYHCIPEFDDILDWNSCITKWNIQHGELNIFSNISVFQQAGFKVAIKVAPSFYHSLISSLLVSKRKKPKLFFGNSIGWIHAGMCPSFVHEYMRSLCFPGLVSGYWAWLCSVFNGNAMQEQAMCLGYMCVRNGILVSSLQCNCLPY